MQRVDDYYRHIQERQAIFRPLEGMMDKVDTLNFRTLDQFEALNLEAHKTILVANFFPNLETSIKSGDIQAIKLSLGICSRVLTPQPTPETVSKESLMFRRKALQTILPVIDSAATSPKADEMTLLAVS